MLLSHIVACSSNGVIGKDNKIPWYISEDLRHFKKLTQHHTIIMGRKTYESIGHPLPNRRNIIVTKTLLPTAEVKIEIVSTLDEALRCCPQDEESFIIGGSTIYQQTITLIKTIYMTKVHKIVEGDVFYPEIPNTFNLVDQEDKDGFSFLVYKQKT
jgi:dihydrofolate reductase